MADNRWRLRPYLSGSQFPAVFDCVCWALVIYQLFLVGLMALRQMATASPTLLILVAATMYYWHYAKR
jgi:hypothetical protein